MRPLTGLGATILAAAALLAGTPAHAVLIEGVFSGILNDNRTYKISFSADVVAFEDDVLFSSAPGLETRLSVLIDSVEVFNEANASVSILGFTGGLLSSLEIYGDNSGGAFSSSNPPDFAYIIERFDPMITFPTFGQTNIVQLGDVFTQTGFGLPTSFDVTVSGAFAVPVPVPASWTLFVPALVGLGVAAVGVRRRRGGARSDASRSAA